jgi:hypothetical protein
MPHRRAKRGLAQASARGSTNATSHSPPAAGQPFDSTPYKKSSSYNTSDFEPPTRTQLELQNLFDNELYHSTFESSSVTDLLCPAPQGDVDAVIAKLAKDRLLNCEHYPNAPKHPQRWPKSGGKRKFYKPLCSLLNGILEAFKGTPIASARHYHDSLSFSVYDRPTMEGVDNVASLKPDGVGTHMEIVANQRIYWHQAELVVEVKDSWPHMITQSATYARCLLAARKNRWFVLVIAFNHKKTEARFCFYHRAGLMLTSALNLRNEEGFRTFVRGVIGIALWPDAAAAGMDISRDDHYFMLPHAGLYRIATVFCDRRCVRGRATRVYRLEKVPHSPDKSKAIAPQSAYPSKTDYNEPPEELMTERTEPEWMKLYPRPCRPFSLAAKPFPNLKAGILTPHQWC